MRLRFVPFLLLLALPACFLFRSHGGVNVLVIVVDSFRADALSRSLGSARTPNLSALTADGLAYRACYAQSSATLPAHAAILSARPPHSSGVRNDGQGIDANLPLLGDALRAEGWQTFGDVSTDELAPPAKDQGIDRGFALFRTHEDKHRDADDVNSHLIPFIEHANTDSPWFAYVQYSDPARADELTVQKPVVAKVVLDGAPIGSVRTKDNDDDWSVEVDVTPGPHRLELRSEDSFNLRRLDITSSGARFTPTYEQGNLYAPVSRIAATFVNDRDSVVTCHFEVRVRAVQNLADCRAHYKAQIESVDRAVGDVVASLKKLGRYEDTVIVVTGSHGEALGEHGMTGHDITLYDEVLRVPLVIKPAQSESRRVDLAKHQFELVRHIDIAPTLLEMVGESPLSGSEGLSLYRDGDRQMLAESHPPEAPSSILARRDDRYKLVYVALEDRFEMYDVKSDTLEMENIFTLQGHFRMQWQTELRKLAESAPQTANLHTGFTPKVPAAGQRDVPRSAKN